MIAKWTGDAFGRESIYDEHIVWDFSNWRGTTLGMETVYEGHEGVRNCWRDWLASFSVIGGGVEEFIDAGDHVVAVVREHNVGRASGAPAEGTHFALWTLAGGKVTRLEIFDDRRQALEAAGVDPD